MGGEDYNSTLSFSCLYVDLSGQLHTSATLRSDIERSISICYDVGWAPKLLFAQW
jgi:hypothetical protein